MASRSRSRSNDMDVDTPKQNVEQNVKSEFKGILVANSEILK